MPRIVTVKAPLGGVVKATAFQSRPPFTTFDSVNYWPIDAKTGRALSATRPSLQSFAGVVDPVHMVHPINGVKASQPFNSFAISVNGTLYWYNASGSFTVATGAEASGIDTGRYVSAAAVVDDLYITRAGDIPLVFNYPAGTVTEPTAVAGSFPTDCRIAANIFGALCLTGKVDSDSHILHLSRVGDPLDWDYAAAVTDQFGAFNSDTEYRGVLSGPVTAVAQHTSDRALISTFSGMLGLHGHPRQGGVFLPISTSYIIGQNAWCRVPGDVLFMMTPNGLMALDPSPSAVPAQVSRNKIPEELVGLEYNYDDPGCCLVYDSRWNGVHIFHSGSNGPQSWLYDLENGGFHEMDLPTDVFTAAQFDQVASQQSGSVLLGTPVGLHYYDRFGTESIGSGVTVGPIKLSQTAATKGRLDKASFVFGRDTPIESGGTITIAAGRDGQDAINRMDQGLAQYTTSLSAVRDNNGVCYPKVSGHAVVIKIESPTGDVAWEEVVLEMEDAGDNRLSRVPQAGVTGSPLPISEGDSGFDEDDWVGYTEATPIAPGEALGDYTMFVDLSTLDTAWWDAVKAGGGDIRVTDANNNPLPVHVIRFDKANNQGLIAFKTDVPATPDLYRIWVGRFNGVQPPVDDDYGQYNAYDSAWRLFWPFGGGEDATQFQNDATFSFFITEGDVTGPIGATATDYSGDDQARATIDDFISVENTDLTNLISHTMITVAQFPTAGTNSLPAVTIATGANSFQLTTRVSGSSTPNAYTQGNYGTAAAETSNQNDSEDWNHYSSRNTAANFLRVMFNGNIAGAGTSTNPHTVAISDADNLRVGGSNLPNSSPPIYQSFVQFHTVERNDNWINYQASMFDQASFWGSWSTFVEVNPGAGDPVYDEDACPLGEVAVTETGTWDGYVELTPPANILALNDYTLFIDLSVMPTDFWAAVETDGVDIRATDQDDLFLPFDLIEFDSAANTGLLAVKLAPNDSLITDVRIWAGNSSAVAVNACARYGQYQAYDSSWLAFWPAGSGNDRTQNQNHLTSQSTAAVDAAGPINNQGTPYNVGGSLGTAPADISHVIIDRVSKYADGSAEPFASFSIVAAVKRGSGLNATNYPTGIIAAVGEPIVPVTDSNVTFNPVYTGMAMLYRAYSFSRVQTRVGPLLGAGFVDAYNGVSATGALPETWFAAGCGHNQRFAFAEVNDSTSDTQAEKLSNPTDKVLVNIGGLHAFGSTTNDTQALYSPFAGTLSLLGLRTSATSPEFIAAYHDMLDQATLWGTPTWSASTSTLPQ